jgi:hypothetical protein
VYLDAEFFFEEANYVEQELAEEVLRLLSLGKVVVLERYSHLGRRATDFDLPYLEKEFLLRGVRSINVQGMFMRIEQYWVLITLERRAQTSQRLASSTYPVVG